MFYEIMEFFDSHSHLNDEKFDGDRLDLIKRIKDENVTKFLTCGYNLESSKKAIEIASDCDATYSTVGISPNDIPQTEEELWKQLDEMEKLLKLYINNNEKDNIIENGSEEVKHRTGSDKKDEIKNSKQEKFKKNNKIVAIGEIGLDYYWNKENSELQKQAFIKQIEIANKMNLPIIIHTREAVMDTLKILKEHNVKKMGVFHCCPLNRELVKEGLKLGFYISFSGVVTFKNSKNADEIIDMVPLEKILIETDSPYLAPEPVRGTRNTPINVKFVAEKIANVKNMDLEEIAKITYENAERLFGC